MIVAISMGAKKFCVVGVVVLRLKMQAIHETLTNGDHRPEYNK